MPLKEAIGWLESERNQEVSYPLSGYRTALTTAIVNSQDSRRATEVRRATMLRIGLANVALATGCLIIILFRGP